ncbi:hypothetical protein H112_00732 [Trichophyton rubrum D6]|uniref:Uncharacterized protein n=3 Tax=Trichophyton TaxID=5550 RepID=A0A080WR78_TRIRC|nr:uncharacterized protein TERG_12604 [Trichophyton rubrum CBS 118892]EZF27219.1 hypothetical protein H100_00731 [Trichophyton rubrum MR850]EZF46370.1 hypothetical protein H102_00721 [Trichophyton rubrum CBS 100081]EZF56992.1 hypothetical protein H103_00727 [Trichophyton rubrum CBS 288.86]EZF67622.1 hypothetical protein H104_00715 [Trichophyton rubrum CBS 289.86]EZF78092.1 hypothetical protein H105_00725 [Trichophyton soudanense CBS 452.61]EZF99618.1 hypothetical protein H113_00730 [Trichophy
MNERTTRRRPRLDERDEMVTRCTPRQSIVSQARRLQHCLKAILPHLRAHLDEKTAPTSPPREIIEYYSPVPNGHLSRIPRRSQIMICSFVHPVSCGRRRNREEKQSFISCILGCCAVLLKGGPRYR